MGGLKVAIVGLTDDGSKATTHFSNTQDIEFHDQWEVGQAVLEQANAEADVVILLSHLHGATTTCPSSWTASTWRSAAATTSSAAP